MQFSEPAILIGDGEYNINNIKKIQVTDDYLGLDQDVRKCQNEEPFYNCTTRLYLDTVLGRCGCLTLKWGKCWKLVKNNILCDSDTLGNPLLFKSAAWMRQQYSNQQKWLFEALLWSNCYWLYKICYEKKFGKHPSYVWGLQPVQDSNTCSLWIQR